MIPGFSHVMRGCEIWEWDFGDWSPRMSAAAISWIFVVSSWLGWWFLFSQVNDETLRSESVAYLPRNKVETDETACPWLGNAAGVGERGKGREWGDLAMRVEEESAPLDKCWGSLTHRTRQPDLKLKREVNFCFTVWKNRVERNRNKMQFNRQVRSAYFWHSLTQRN